MAKIINGERIGREARIRVGCSAVIFEPGEERILLTRRADNGRWCLPSGAMDPGESAAEACEREVWEETGLHVQVVRLVGVYSSPHRIVAYPDGNRWQVVALHFLAKVTGGALQLSAETTEFGYFSIEEMEGMDIIETHRERITDSFENQLQAIIR